MKKSDNPFRSAVSFAPKGDDETAEKAPAAGEERAEKKAGVKVRKYVTGPHGVIQHIEQGERYGRDIKDTHASVTIRHGEPPKPKKGEISDYSAKESRIHLPPSALEGLKVGDRVSVHLKKH